MYQKKKIHNRLDQKKSLSYPWICIFVLGIFAMLFPIYERIAELYGYMYRFEMNPSESKSIISVIPYLTLITLFLYYQQKRGSISDLFIILLTLFYFLPGNILYLYGNWSDLYYLFHLLSYVFISIANELIPKIKLREGNRVSSHKFESSVAFLSYFISISVILIVSYYNGFSININLNEVYEMRNEWKASNMPNIFNYYIPFASRCIPLLLLITLKERLLLPSLSLILAQLVSFSFGGMKYTLFALILAILFHFFGKRINCRRIVVYFSIFVSVCFLECLFVHNSIPILTTYLLRRMSFVPNQIGFYYFDFFQTRDYLYYSESFLRWLLDYPYSTSFTHIIGNYAFELPSMGANTGLFAEGFSQIGWLALPLYSILYVISFRFYDACSLGFQRSKFSHVPLLGIILYFSSFTDGAFFSVMLTQGFFLTLLTLYYLSFKLRSIRHETTF